MRPYYLDGDLDSKDPSRCTEVQRSLSVQVIPVMLRRPAYRNGRRGGYCVVFKDRWEFARQDVPSGLSKLNSMHQLVRKTECLQPAGPSSVDVLAMRP